MTLELVPLCRITANLRQPFVLSGTPAGDRLIFEVESGTVEGDRLTGTMKGHSTADWLVVGPDGTGTIDVRSLIETHDGALIFVQYLGRVDLSGGGDAPIYIAPRFDTGDDRYRWLNKIQAVAKGQLDGHRLQYDVYQVT